MTVEFVDYDFNEQDRRVVHITIVIKLWARVVSTTEIDIYALGAVDQVGQTEVSAATGSSAETGSASQFGDNASASKPPSTETAYGKENVVVTGPGIEPTAGAAMAVAGAATVTGNSVNVRTGPGTNFPVVAKMTAGDKVTLKDQAFGWYKVVLADGSTTGWIAGWLLDTTGG